MPANHDWLVVRAGAKFRLGSGIDELTEHEIFSALCWFINENGLSHEPLTLRASSGWEGFEIRSSHLTGLGQKVMKEGLNRWMSAIDRGTLPSRSKILQKAFEKCQNLSASN